MVETTPTEFAQSIYATYTDEDLAATAVSFADAYTAAKGQADRLGFGEPDYYLNALYVAATEINRRRNDLREHPTRTGHFHARVVREDGEEIRRCTSSTHSHIADANLCAFDAMWKEAAAFMAQHPEVVIDPYEAHEEAHRENEQRWVERELPNLTVEDIDEMRELSVKIRRYTRYVSELLAEGKRPGDAILRQYTETIRLVSRDLAENYGLSVNVHSGNRWEIEFAGVPH